MLKDIPHPEIVIPIATFVAGWVFCKLVTAIGNRGASGDRDPRDGNIRSLDAELRIARGELEKVQQAVLERDEALEAAKRVAANADEELSQQQEVIETLKTDLRSSVRKTRELRSELTSRATENIRSEVKLREVETELSVAQATTDLIATGVLDYSDAPDAQDDDSRKIQQARR